MRFSSCSPPLSLLTSLLHLWTFLVERLLYLWRREALVRKYGRRAVRTHLQLQRQIRGCLSCARLFLPEESFVTCGICSDHHDLCLDCFRKQGPGIRRRRSIRAPMDQHPMLETSLPFQVDKAPLRAATSVSEAIERALWLFGPRRCIGWRPSVKETEMPTDFAAKYHWLTYAQVLEQSTSFGQGLEGLLLGPLARQDEEAAATTAGRPPPLVGVLGAVCPQWFFSDYACLLKGIGVVLFHRATSAACLAHVLVATELSVLVVSRHLRSLVSEALDLAYGSSSSSSPSSCDDGESKSSRSRALTHIIYMDDNAAAHPAVVAEKPQRVSAAAKWGITEASWQDVRAAGARQAGGGDAKARLGGSVKIRAADAERGFTDPRRIVKLLPSSGSTGGTPKLIVVTEGQLRGKVLAMARAEAKSLAGTTTVYAYETMRQSHEVILQGGCIGCFTSLANIQEDCQLLQPTVFAATPTFWNGLVAEFEGEVRRRRRRKVKEAAATDTTGGRSSTSNDNDDAWQEVLLEWKDRRPLGNRLQVLISTGAPLAHRVARWLFRFCGRMILNAYGTTETGTSSTSQNRERLPPCGAG